MTFIITGEQSGAAGLIMSMPAFHDFQRVSRTFTDVLTHFHVQGQNIVLSHNPKVRAT